MKYFFGGLFVLLLALASFLFYATSTTLDESDYNSIEKYGIQNQTSDSVLTVVSYNIGYMSGMTNNQAVDRNQALFDENLSKSIDLLEKLDPDIIGFQEIDYDADRSFNVDQLNRVCEKIGFFNAQKSVNWDKAYVPFPYFPLSAHFGQVVSGQAIVSKFPIVSSERIVLDKPINNPFYYNALYIDRLVQVSELDIVGKRVMVLSVHLEAYDQTAREEQAEVVSKIYQEYSNQFPTLLIGDFNAEPYDDSNQDKTFEIIMQSGNIAHAFDRLDLEKSHSKFSTFSSVDPQLKIDYIFFNPDQIVPLEYKVVSEAGDISDHLPVLMKFQLR